jgi:hypothetical protein
MIILCKQPEKPKAISRVRLIGFQIYDGIFVWNWTIQKRGDAF